MKFKAVENRPGEFIFQCPGCDSLHMTWTALPNDLTGAKWQFNGDVNRPTISPSLLVRWDYGPEKTKHVCHSFIKDGMIQFLSDCTHALAGQTVEIPEFNS